MTDLDRWRCPHCRRMLAEVHLAPGSVVRIRCDCKVYVTLNTCQPQENAGTVTTA